MAKITAPYSLTNEIWQVVGRVTDKDVSGLSATGDKIPAHLAPSVQLTHKAEGGYNAGQQDGYVTLNGVTAISLQPLLAAHGIQVNDEQANNIIKGVHQLGGEHIKSLSSASFQHYYTNADIASFNQNIQGTMLDHSFHSGIWEGRRAPTVTALSILQEHNPDILATIFPNEQDLTYLAVHPGSEPSTKQRRSPSHQQSLAEGHQAPPLFAALNPFSDTDQAVTTQQVQQSQAFYSGDSTKSAQLVDAAMDALKAKHGGNEKNALQEWNNRFAEYRKDYYNEESRYYTSVQTAQNKGAAIPENLLIKEWNREKFSAGFDNRADRFKPVLGAVAFDEAATQSAPQVITANAPAPEAPKITAPSPAPEKEGNWLSDIMQSIAGWVHDQKEKGGFMGMIAGLLGGLFPKPEATNVASVAHIPNSQAITTKTDMAYDSMSENIGQTLQASGVSQTTSHTTPPPMAGEQPVPQR